jgi:hypothetical protein
MFDRIPSFSRNDLVSFCCAGIHCEGDDPSSKVFFKFLPGRPLENKIVLWLRLGRDEEFVRNLVPPNADERSFSVVEELT